jgi:hypothetical protein
MISHIQNCVQYLRQTLGLVLAPVPWSGDGQMPFFLRKNYWFFELDMLGTQVLLMLEGRSDDEHTPAVIEKHIAQVRTIWGGQVVYVRETVTAYDRKRMIERAVPFIVPGNQMYLPGLGIDLREHFIKSRAKARKFSPAAQALLIYLLLYRKELDLNTGVTPGRMSKLLGYSAITLTRAFDEMEAAKIGHFEFEGRERMLAFPGASPDIWKEAQAFLRTPITKRVWAVLKGSDLPGLSAGISGLAQYTLLAEPANKVLAVSLDSWRALAKSGPIIEIPYEESGAVEIEVWRYAPNICARGSAVDPLSLFLSLKGHSNERVVTALENMLEVLKW